MSQSYSVDLRERVVSAYKKGEKWYNICAIYQIGKSTLYEWLSLEEETGSLNPRKNTGGQRAKIQNLEKFKIFIDKNPDKTLSEYADLWNEKVSTQAIRTALKKLNYSRKKKAILTKKVV